MSVRPLDNPGFKQNTGKVRRMQEIRDMGAFVVQNSEYTLDSLTRSILHDPYIVNNPYFLICYGVLTLNRAVGPTSSNRAFRSVHAESELLYKKF